MTGIAAGIAALIGSAFGWWGTVTVAAAILAALCRGAGRGHPLNLAIE